MAAVWDHVEADPTMKLLLLALADFADSSGTCWPSYPTLSGRVGVSERQVRRLVLRAEALGYLTRQRGGRGPGNSTRYTLQIGRGTPASPMKRDTRGAMGDTRYRGRGTPTSLEPSGNHHIEPEGNDGHARIETTEALRRARALIEPRIFGRRAD